MRVAVLLAGGKGTRIGKDIPKQHIIIEHHELIEYTIKAFNCPECIDKIIVVSNKDYISYVEKFIPLYSKLVSVIPGGETRSWSVYNAIKFISNFCTNNDKIIISDAARPCITTQEIDNIVTNLDIYDAVTTAIFTNETLLKIQNKKIIDIIPRDGILRQTSPEGYKYSVLKWLYLDSPQKIVNSYKNIGIDQLYASGVDIGIVLSNLFNFKITTLKDLELFKTVLQKGFDSIISS